jgi:hypothetical protein
MNIVGQEDPAKEMQVFSWMPVQVLERVTNEVSMRLGLFASTLALAVIAALLPRAARADIDGDRYSSTQWRVRMTAPKNWHLTEQTSYPNVLLWMVRHAPDGKMMLTAERTQKGEDALAYATRTSELLSKIGFSLRAPQLHGSTGAYWIDFDNGRVFLRQAFLVVDGVGYALTLSAEDVRTRSAHLRAFDYALRSIRPMRASEAAAEAAKEAAADEQNAEPSEGDADKDAPAPAPEHPEQPEQPDPPNQPDKGGAKP